MQAFQAIIANTAPPATLPAEPLKAWAIVSCVGPATQFEVRSPAHREVAQSLAEKFHDHWPAMSSTVNTAFRSVEDLLTKGSEPHKFRICIDDQFVHKAGHVRWLNDDIVLEIHSESEAASPPAKADAEGLTRTQRLLIFELMNAASKEAFDELRRQMNDGFFEDKASGGQALPKDVKKLVRKDADVPALLYALKVEKIEHGNAQRCWKAIQELGSPTMDSEQAQAARRLAELSFDEYVAIQAEKGHMAKIRDRYLNSRQSLTAPAAQSLP